MNKSNSVSIRSKTWLISPAMYKYDKLLESIKDD